MAARAFDPDAPEIAEGTHPGEHLAVSLPGGRDAIDAEQAVEMIDDRRAMEILAGVAPEACMMHDAAGNMRILDHLMAPCFRT